MGHIGKSGINVIIQTGYLPIKNSNFDCESCLKGKMCRKEFEQSNTKSKEIIDLIHFDVCGPSL